MEIGLRVEPIDRDRWIETAARFTDFNYRQSWDFGVHSAARVGATSEHVAVSEGPRIVALADVRVRRLPVFGGGLAYVTGGPLTRSGGECDPLLFVSVVDALRREYASRRGLVLRIVPPIGPPDWNCDAAAGLARCGFVPTDAVRGYRTIALSIDRPLEEIRKGLRQKWRNCLNRSEREGLVVRSANDVESLDQFTELFDAFVGRKAFAVNVGADFHARVQRDLPESERFLVLTAEKDGVVVAGHVASALGDTMVYLLGATTPQALTCKAAYLLQWRSIELARERRCRWYDLGGIDPEGNPGVFHFKDGLGGGDVSSLGPLEWRSGARSRIVVGLESRYRAFVAARAAGAQPAGSGTFFRSSETPPPHSDGARVAISPEPR